VNKLVIVALPFATQFTVTVIFVFAAADCVAGDTVAFDVALLLFPNDHATFDFIVYVIDFPATTVHAVALIVNVGVAFAIVKLSVAVTAL